MKFKLVPPKRHAKWSWDKQWTLKVRRWFLIIPYWSQITTYDAGDGSPPNDWAMREADLYRSKSARRGMSFTK